MSAKRNAPKYSDNGFLQVEMSWGEWQDWLLATNSTEMTFEQMTERFRQYNETEPHDIVYGYMVITSATANKGHYLPVKSRTYIVPSNGKWFHGSSNSLIEGMLLDYDSKDCFYLPLGTSLKELGCENGKVIDYCYVPDDTLRKINRAMWDKIEADQAKNNHYQLNVASECEDRKGTT